MLIAELRNIIWKNINWYEASWLSWFVTDGFPPSNKNKTINGYQVVFTEVNCSEETAEVDKMMNQYNVEGYPTIKLLKDGQVIEYDAKPSKETLTQFLNTVL